MSEEEYGTGDIRQLHGLDPVRERPGMFLGDPGSGEAMHHCVWEAVDNAVDEHLAGHCDTVGVELHPGGGVTVSDNGRGIPVGIHPTEGKNTLEMVMTSLHTGGKFDAKSYEKSSGLHGVGIAAVNAVSEECAVRVHRDGKVWSQTYAAGVPTTDVMEIGETDSTGTIVTWVRDLTIFKNIVEYDRKIIVRRLEELAFLNPGLKLILTDSRGGKQTTKVFQYDGGITEYLNRRTNKKTRLIDVLHFRDGLGDNWSTEIGMTWTTSSGDDVRCYANNTFNRDGGTHLTGFRAGLTRVITAYAKEHNLLKNLKEGITGTDIRDGLVAVVNVRIGDPMFSSQTKEKLVTQSARNLVEDLFRDQVDYYLGAHPGIAKKIAERAVLNARMREAAKKAREEVMRKTFTDRSTLPGKLADCHSKDPAESEIFIVEGDSAGGSSKGARDRATQAILPLRGKVLNVERVGLDTLLQNEEINTLITALGCGIEQNRSFDLKKLRYHKIILTTDADVDGAHIRTLLLTFFHRCMPRLLKGGYVYAAVPPLFSARFGNKPPVAYFHDKESRDAFLAGLPKHQRKTVHIQRYKGLGEMNPDQLRLTTLDPETRTLKKMTVDDAIELENAIEILMGSQVDPRREWIEANARFVEELDV